jgi:hypothetical protein
MREHRERRREISLYLCVQRADRTRGLQFHDLQVINPRVELASDYGALSKALMAPQPMSEHRAVVKDLRQLELLRLEDCARAQRKRIV